MSKPPLPVRVMTLSNRLAARWRRAGTDRPSAVSATEHSRPQHAGLGGMFLGRMDANTRPPMPEDPRERLRFLTEVVPNMARSMIGISRSAWVMRRNPTTPRRELSTTELAEVEQVARRWGVDLLGYTRLDPDHVFTGRRVLDRNVIVLAMEMDREDLAKSPHFDAESEVHWVYADLGLAAFKVAKRLRRLGVAAEAGTALGGDTSYPPIAEAAGIGRVGRNGLLLTEQFGPRVRLAVVYCSVDTLPFHDPADTRHDWIRGFCDMCGACVRKCPPQAIRAVPVEHENGALSYVDGERCFPYFAANYGCAVCIKVCPFSFADPAQLRRGYDRWRDREATPTTAPTPR